MRNCAQDIYAVAKKKELTQLLRQKSTQAYVEKFNLGGTFMFDKGHKSTQINAKNKFNLWVEHLCLTKVGNGLLGEGVHWKIQHSFTVVRKCHVQKNK